MNSFRLLISFKIRLRYDFFFFSFLLLLFFLFTVSMACYMEDCETRISSDCEAYTEGLCASHTGPEPVWVRPCLCNMSEQQQQKEAENHCELDLLRVPPPLGPPFIHPDKHSISPAVTACERQPVRVSTSWWRCRFLGNLTGDYH